MCGSWHLMFQPYLITAVTRANGAVAVTDIRLFTSAFWSMHAKALLAIPQPSLAFRLYLHSFIDSVQSLADSDR